MCAGSAGTLSRSLLGAVLLYCSLICFPNLAFIALKVYFSVNEVLSKLEVVHTYYVITEGEGRVSK